MFLVLCGCLCPIHWSQVLSREWRCSWSSAHRPCFNYIWVINNFIAYWGVTYVWGSTAILLIHFSWCIRKQNWWWTLVRCHSYETVQLLGWKIIRMIFLFHIDYRNYLLHIDWLIDWFFIWGFQRSMAYQAGLLEVHIQHTGFNS